MNKIYHVLSSLLLLGLLIVGCISLFDKDSTFSQQENRSLKTFPDITFTGILDGSFVQNLSDYYADTFPGREGMLDPKGLVEQLFTFRETAHQTTEPADTQPAVTE